MTTTPTDPLRDELIEAAKNFPISSMYRHQDMADFALPYAREAAELRERNARHYRVGLCETYEQLAQAIESLADADGMITGRARKFNAKYMAEMCRKFPVSKDVYNLTRMYGIRQQAYYIFSFYNLTTTKTEG